VDAQTVERSALCVGVTGGIGSGKSTVCEVFANLGATLLNADQIGHEVLASDASVQHALAEAFGDDVIGADGVPDRSKLGKRVFGDADALDTLNAIVHPSLLSLLRERMDHARMTPSTLLVVIDAALITEWGIESWFDRVMVVTAPAEVVRERLHGRGLSDDQITRRISSQVPVRERAKRADIIVSNAGTRNAIEDRVRSIWNELTG
jgi:dephospho-CoA kinase